MSQLFIFIDAPENECKVYRVVKPGSQFNNDWFGLTEGVTNSNSTSLNKVKNYHSFKVV